MDLLTVFTRFPDHESCIEHLERVRWGDSPSCPYCHAAHVARKTENDRIGRWNCHSCKSSFNVLAGTIFQKTKVPLQKWFLAISLILNATRHLSSHQLARDLDLNQKTAWFLAMRVRGAMGECRGLLPSIVQQDGAYVGDRPRKPNNHEDNRPNMRECGSSNLPILGPAERGGGVVAMPSMKVEFCYEHNIRERDRPLEGGTP